VLLIPAYQSLEGAVNSAELQVRVNVQWVARWPKKSFGTANPRIVII
jgi:hypothetical protein